MSFLSSKILKGLIILTLLDALSIWIWAKNSDLGPGSGMVLFIDIPFVIVINLIVGIVVFFTKRVCSSLFFINCIIAAVITYLIFTAEMDNQHKEHFDHWSFNLQDTTFNITKWNKLDLFNISYKEGPGSSTEFLEGKCSQKKDTLLLISDSISMYIHSDKLYNFRKSKHPIALRPHD